jgi:hypothetical protein
MSGALHDLNPEPLFLHSTGRAVFREVESLTPSSATPSARSLSGEGQRKEKRS